MRSLARPSIVAALLASLLTACGVDAHDSRSADELFLDPPVGVFHLRVTAVEVTRTEPTDEQKRRTYEAVAPVDGVYTLQFASGLPDAAARPDASRIFLFQNRPEPVLDEPKPPAPLALLVGKSDPRSVSRLALAVRAREVVTIRAEIPGEVPRYDAQGTQTLGVTLFLGAKDASTSDGTRVTRRTDSPSRARNWSFSGAETGWAHGTEIAAFSRVRDGHPVTLYSCVVHDGEGGPEMTSESFTLRLRFLPQPVTSDHAADEE